MSVSVQFDKPRTLQFDISTYRSLEAAMGGKTTAAVIGHMSQVSVRAIVAGLWAGLKHEDPSLTEAAVDAAFDEYVDKGGRIAHLGKALNDAILESGILNDDDGVDDPLSDAHTVELDRLRTVKFGLKSVRRIEDAMGGMGIGTVYDQIGSIGITALTMALAIGLTSDDKNITVNLTTKLLDAYVRRGGSVRKLGRVVQRAIDATGVFKNDRGIDEELEGNAKPEPVQA